MLLLIVCMYVFNLYMSLLLLFNERKKQNKEMDGTFLWFCLMIHAGVVLHNYFSVRCLKGGCLEFSYHHANKIMACLEINRREPGAICISKLRLAHRDLARTRCRSKWTIFKIQFNVTIERNKVRTKILIFFEIFIMKTCKESSKQI